MARVCAAGYDDLSPDSDDDSPRLTKDPRSAACGAEVSPLKPVMPRVLTTVSSMVKHPETSTWHVRMGDDVPKFLYANGPARIVFHKELVVRRSAGPKQGYSDIFELTPASRVTSSHTVVWRVELACTGASLYGKPPPNCQRPCCAGFGVCYEGCKGGSRYGCSVKVVIEASKAAIEACEVKITLLGEHVPFPMRLLHPPPDGRKPMPAVLTQLGLQCAQGGLPTRVANAAAAMLGEGIEHSSRFVPPAHVLRGLKKRDSRCARGGAMDDTQRIDELIRKHLVQRNMVLLYIPGEHLILTTPWALERARVDGKKAVTTDAKVDTVTGVRSKWSSIRCKTPRGLSVPLVVGISPTETAVSIERLVGALALNVRCSSPSCAHTLVEMHGADGRYERRLSCERWWSPAFTIDKHIPSFTGLHAAQIQNVFLCSYHGFHCFDSRLVELGIMGSAADFINWGFRLLTRAGTDAAAFALRNTLATILVSQAAMQDRLWTLRQAEEVVTYIDRCWMYPEYIRKAWIDAWALLIPGRLSTTGINERSHAHYAKMCMKSQTNRLVSESIVKTIGITADGKASVEGGFFNDAERRWMEAEGRPLHNSTDRMVRYARACVAFLKHGLVQVIPRTFEVLTVDEYEARVKAELAAELMDGRDEEEEGGCVRDWHRHRRQSGGRMSSSFLPTPVPLAMPMRAPTDQELTALVSGFCESVQLAISEDADADVHQQKITLGTILARFVNNMPSVDIADRRDCITMAHANWLLNTHVRITFPGCSFVRRMGSKHGDCIRRHGEASSSLRSADAVHPDFPAQLEPMLKVLKHGGEGTSRHPIWACIDNATGRCECLDSVYHGVMSVVLTGNCEDERGACKHHQLSKLCKEADGSKAAFETVHSRCAAFLCDYVGERERSKPEKQRCKALYEPARAQDISGLLTALESHPSTPSSGKGVAMGGLSDDDDEAGEDAEEARKNAVELSGEEDDVEGKAMMALEALSSLPRRQCTFSALTVARDGLGLAMVYNDEAGGGVGVVVSSYRTLRGGGLGPAAHEADSEALQPGDVILTVEAGVPNLSERDAALTPEGELVIASGVDVKLLFVRYPRSRSAKYLGGRPAAAKPKYGRNAAGKRNAHSSRVRDTELLGGAPARSAKKPQKSRASAREAVSAGQPEPDEQVAALLRGAMHARGSEEGAGVAAELENIAAGVLQRLLQPVHLSEEARAARDSELAEMVYSQ